MTTPPTDDVIDHALQLVEDGELEEARSLFEQHPGLVHVDPGLGSWLHCAVGDTKMLAMLLELGCDINSTYSVGDHMVTPVMTALSEDDPDSLALLLEHGAKLPDGRNLLHAVVGDKRHCLELLKTLQRFGADLTQDFVDEESGVATNALSVALDYERGDVVEFLRSIGCELPGVTPGKASTPHYSYLLKAMTDEFGVADPRTLVELVATEPAIIVHAAAANERTQCLTLFTTGVSDTAMSVPAGEERFSRAELFIQLPPSWPYRDLGDNDAAWPALWLRALAAYPHSHNTWLGGAAAIIGEDVLGISIGGRFSAMLLLCEKEFPGVGGCRVVGYRLFPLYGSEVAFERSKGIGALLKLFDQRAVGFVVNMDRTPVV